MNNQVKEIVDNGFPESEWDVRFCPKCGDMKLFHYRNGKWTCTECTKKPYKNERRNK